MHLTLRIIKELRHRHKPGFSIANLVERLKRSPSFGILHYKLRIRELRHSYIHDYVHPQILVIDDSVEPNKIKRVLLMLSYHLRFLM